MAASLELVSPFGQASAIVIERIAW